MRRTWLLAAALAMSTAAHAQVDVTGAWARPTVAGQHGTGAFMTLRAQEPLRLVGVTSPVAGVVEIHSMKMEGDVMQMRALDALDLPANTIVRLQPGGYHMMLMDLKRALRKGESIPVELRLEKAGGQRLTQTLQIEVRTDAPISKSKLLKK